MVTCRFLSILGEGKKCKLRQLEEGHVGEGPAGTCTNYVVYEGSPRRSISPEGQKAPGHREGEFGLSCPGTGTELDRFRGGMQ